MDARRLLGFGMALAAAVAACSSEPASTPAPVAQVAAPAQAESGLVTRASALGAHGLRSILGERGAAIAPHGGAWRFAPSPTRFGCDGARVELASPTRGHDGRRVAYARPELGEWYAETPQGLEQGFSIPAPPPCRRAGGRGVVIELGGGLRAVLSADGHAARLHDESGSEVLCYTDLHVRDAKGRELPSRLEADGTKLAIRFDDTSATYPVEVDPTMWAVQQALAASDAHAGAQFGGSAALSADTVVVGAPSANGGAAGEAYVFVRSGLDWEQQQAMKGLDAASKFGASVAVSNDTALVGAPGFASVGAAYFFERSGTTWTMSLEADSPSSSVVNAGFGTSVALDGDTALVTSVLGAPSCVFVRSANSWDIQQIIQPPTMAVDAGVDPYFGAASALSGDTAIIGAPYDLSSMGSAYVFVRAGTTWTLQQQLTAPDGVSGDQFGMSVALDGDTAIVGAPNDAATHGRAYVFTRTGTTWTMAQELSAPAMVHGSFALSVALSGSVAMVNGYIDDSATGAVFVYALSGSSWNLQQTLAPDPQATSDRLGAGLALQGTRAVVGAPGPGPASGAAYVFVLAAAAGDACASSDACVSGACVDGVCCTTASCPPASDCNVAETCQAGTGTCSHTPINEGMACDAGPCMGDATCHDGACVPQPPVCAPPDDCHDFGTCDPSTNACVNPPKADGQPCAKGTCVGGVCQAGPQGTGGGGSSGGGAASASKGCACTLDPAPVAGPEVAALAALLLLARRRRARVSCG